MLPIKNRILGNLGACIGCLLAAVFTLWLAGVHTGISLIWLPSGVVIAVAVLAGVSAWPGVLIAMLLVGWWVNGSLIFAASLALGSVAGLFLAHLLLVKRSNFSPEISRLSDALHLIVSAGLVSTIPMSLLAVSGYLLGGGDASPGWQWLAINWWLGDFIATLVVTPVILTWASWYWDKSELRPGRIIEGTIILIALGVACWTAFSWQQIPHMANYPFTIFPFLIWAAVRFGPRGAASSTLLVAAFAISGTSHNWGLFSRSVEAISGIQHISEIMLLAFLGAVALTGLMLSSVTSERESTSSTLANSEERYRSLFNSNPLALIIYDPKTLAVIEVNLAAMDIYGFSVQDWSSSVLHNIAEKDKNIWRKFLQSDVSDRWEGRHVNASGSTLEVIAHRYEVYFNENDAFLLSIEDVTESRHARAALLETEQKLDLHLQQTALGMIEWDTENCVRSWNAAAEKIFGFSAEEVLGKNIIPQIVPLSDQDLVKGIFNKLYEKRGGSFSSNRNLNKDGRVLVCEWFNTPLVDHENKVRGIASLVHDITEREIASVKLRQSEEKFRSVIEASPLGIHIFELNDDDELILIGANTAANRALGFGDDDCVGRKLEDAFPTLRGTDIPVRYREVANGGAAWSADQVTYDGERVAGAFELTAFRTESGLIVSMLLDVTERRRAEEALRLREKAMEATTQGIVIFRNRGDSLLEAIYANPAVERISGYAGDEVLGRNWDFFVGKDNQVPEAAAVRRAAALGQPALVELIAWRKDGTTFQAGFALSPIRSEEGEVSHFVAVLTDLGPMKKLEAQFRQSQKMEAIGRLAGGVAHDFNNLLTAIIGYNDLILNKTDPTGSIAESSKEIQKASERAAALTGQLLAFSRQQTLLPQLVDLNAIVEGVQNLLGRLIGDTINVKAELASNLGKVKAEPGQIEQVLMNLAINARDAMREGGTLTIHTGNVTVTDTLTDRSSDFHPGAYVLLCVADTGSGMSQEVKEHLFEPFFTTKEKGKGTGLGLATCYGIIKQSGGHIRVQSELGRGTTFEVYLPEVRGATGAEVSSPEKLNKPEGGHEKLLVVEDDVAVRPLTISILKSMGYDVLEASDGMEAVKLINAMDSCDIDMVITDVVMPNMGGKELGVWLREHHPEVRILFTSGYIDSPLHGNDADDLFLQKPFTPGKLSARVRQVLDRPISTA